MFSAVAESEKLLDDIIRGLIKQSHSNLIHIDYLRLLNLTPDKLIREKHAVVVHNKIIIKFKCKII